MGSKVNRPIRVLVATPLGEGGKGGVDRMMDVVRRTLCADPDSRLDVAFITVRGPGSILFSPLFLTRAIASIGARKALGRADVLHVNLGQDGSTLRKLVLCRWARLLDIPYVIHLHGAGYREFWDGARPFLSRAIGRMFAGAASVVVLGRVWRDYVQLKAPGVEPVIVPNATEAPRARPGAPSTQALTLEGQSRTGPVQILFLGELGPRKGVPDLLAALERLKPLDWRATIAGNGQIAATMSAVATAGLSERIDIPGWLGAADVEAQLAQADVLVLPSYEENLPVSVIEGMAYGLAIVTTPVGAVPDIIEDGVSGLLCEPGDVDALARALERVILDRELRVQLGGAARAFHGRHLDAPRYVDRLKAIWLDAGMRPRQGFRREESPKPSQEWAS